MNLFNRGFGNIFNGGIFGNYFPIVMDEPNYPQISVIDVVDGILDTLRGIESDKLTQEKELVEIEATVSTYADYTKFHQDTLNKSYDLEKKDVLLDTLIHLISNDFNYTITADELFIHRNTLYQRLNKIESIIKMSIKSAETKLVLNLGIKYKNIMDITENGNNR